MTKLGKRQIDQLASLGGVFGAVVLSDPLLRSLCRRGLMESLSTKPGRDGFVAITPAGQGLVILSHLLRNMTGER